ncbi:MAG: leucyl aminopeptidase [Gemmatimonadota bacterium]
MMDGRVPDASAPRDIRVELADGRSHGELVVVPVVGSPDGAAPGPGVGSAADLTGGALGRALRDGLFRPGEEESRLFPGGADGGPHVLAAGVGENGLDGHSARRIGAAGIRSARDAGLESVELRIPDLDPPPAADVVQAAAEGLVLGDWRLETLQTSGDDVRRGPRTATISLPDGAAHEELRIAAARGRIVAQAQNYARALVALPANVATPGFLADRALDLGRDGRLEVEVFERSRLAELGFGALLAVSRGSVVDPRLIVVEHAGEGGPPVVLVGKGVTFDSGGLSLKPPKGMEEMKTDMAGAAAVFGTLRAAAALKLPRRIVGIVPATENLPSGSALKPGDVIRGLSGRSIEVVNTDAEGRLILSDALTWARRLEPEAIVDLATLTGGCVVALGHHASGLFSTSDDLAEALRAAGERSHERLCRLPVWEAYRRQLDSDIADLKNSAGRDASPITAAAFLREFAGEVPWAHLDIAGTAWADEPGPWQPKGATGVGVRLLVEWLDAG